MIFVIVFCSFVLLLGAGNILFSLKEYSLIVSLH